MRTRIKLPKLAETTDVVVLNEWLVDVGDPVALNQALANIETDKITMEFPSPVAGVVIELHADADDEIRTGDAVCTIET